MFTLHTPLAKTVGHTAGSKSAPPSYPHQPLLCCICAHAGIVGHTWEKGEQSLAPELTLSTWFTISFMQFCTARKSLCFLNCGKDTE